MTPNNFRIKNGLTVSNGVTISAGNVVITSGQLVIGATSINATSMSDGANNAYTNAIAIAANGSNITSGTVAFARLPSLFVGTTTIQSTSAAQAVTGITTLAAGNTTITGDITVSGNLTINGTTTNINSTDLLVEDKNIILGDVTTPSDVTADGGGITLKGTTDKTFNFVDATDSWTASENIDLASGKTFRISNTLIANSTALGTNILASSLTSVGTLSSLTLGGAVSGITTLASGNTTITGFANVSTTLQVTGITTLSANLAMANNFITRPVLAGYSEHEVSNTAVTGTFTLDFSTANFFDLILTGNTTISPSGIPANTRMVSATLACKQDATGGRTITWPAGTKFPGGVSPPGTTTASAIDIWSIMTYDAGNTYIVSLSVKAAA